MKRSSSKRTSPKRPQRSKPEKLKKHEDICAYCDRKLNQAESALFVEEEVGRTFCAESCINAFFGTEIERLEREYLNALSPDDLSSEEREKAAHLRWNTLQEPQEIWRERTLSGDYRYTLISEFKTKAKTLWCVCICLFLRGEPSFLYLAFVTRKKDLTDRYRRGERMQRVKRSASTEAPSEGSEQEPTTGLTDGLADPWTEDEIQLAERIRGQKADDIGVEEYSEYESYTEETLEKPDEVWSYPSSKDKEIKYFHFIKQYKDEEGALWYVVVARETDQEDQLEITDVFPTRDPQMMQRYRKGNQEHGEPEEQTVSRMVH